MYVCMSVAILAQGSSTCGSGGGGGGRTAQTGEPGMEPPGEAGAQGSARRRRPAVPADALPVDEPSDAAWWQAVPLEGGGALSGCCLLGPAVSSSMEELVPNHHHAGRPDFSGTAMELPSAEVEGLRLRVRQLQEQNEALQDRQGSVPRDQYVAEMEELERAQMSTAVLQSECDAALGERDTLREEMQSAQASCQEAVAVADSRRTDVEAELEKALAELQTLGGAPTDATGEASPDPGGASSLGRQDAEELHQENLRLKKRVDAEQRAYLALERKLRETEASMASELEAQAEGGELRPPDAAARDVAEIREQLLREEMQERQDSRQELHVHMYMYIYIYIYMYYVQVI